MEPHSDFFGDVVSAGFLAFESAFPNYRDPPSRIEKRFDITPVTGDIFVEFLAPIIYVGSRGRRRAAPMSVPEASVYEHDGLESGKDNVRRTRQAFVVEAVSQSKLMQRLPERQLRTGVLLPDT